MTTRAGSAVASRQVKQKLVRLLFQEKYGKQGPKQHAKLDPSIYSFEKLRSAYLKRIQEIHPDKWAHQQNQSCTLSSSLTHKQPQQQQPQSPSTSRKNENKMFVELQTAWKDYEKVAKQMQSVGNHKESNFTMFGVGCSFSDSPSEREYRNEIMDQACRGWFSSGSISEHTSTANQLSKNSNGTKAYAYTPLCDDDLFVPSHPSSTTESGLPKSSPPPSSSSSHPNNNIDTTQKTPKSLIPNMPIRKVKK